MHTYLEHPSRGVVCCCLQVGLVDEVGGLLRATDLAKQLAGLPLEPEATITQEWPPRWVDCGLGWPLSNTIIDWMLQ